MAAKTGYKTKQKERLIEYLESNKGEHITVADVCDYFKNQGDAIGQTTVYRHLEKMVDEGLVNKYIIDGNTPACFEYMGEHTHEHVKTCFHCKCEKCGALIHLHCHELEEIKSHLMKGHGFMLDTKRTVFYGLCKDCQEEK